MFVVAMNRTHFTGVICMNLWLQFVFCDSIVKFTHAWNCGLQAKEKVSSQFALFFLFNDLEIFKQREFYWKSSLAWVLRGWFHALNKQLKRNHMLGWTLIFLIIALIAGVLGFTGIAGAAVGIAKILFFIFLVLFLVSLIVRLAAKWGGSIKPAKQSS